MRDLLQCLRCLFRWELRELRGLCQAHAAEEGAPDPLTLTVAQFRQRISTQRPRALHFVERRMACAQIQCLLMSYGLYRDVSFARAELTVRDAKRPSHQKIAAQLFPLRRKLRVHCA